MGIATVAFLMIAARPIAAQNAPQVRIDDGVLQGRAADGIVTFKGIPYAAAPIGKLRWRAPEPPVAWQGVRAATEFGAVCPQERWEGKPANQSEDCLTLNIWTPQLSGRRAPVLVWFHGGGAVAGSGSEPAYDGASFAKNGVVVVTINYRLGMLGYFAHPALWQEAGRTDRNGNYGLMDHIAALKWVRRNIARFGGDPANVTIGGQSAGGESVLYLLTSPLSRGLFHRAIAQSAPGVIQFKSVADAEARDVDLVRKLGLSTSASADQLRDLPVDKLMADRASAGPYTDGTVIPEIHLRTFAARRQHRVPLLIGNTDGEGSLIEAYPPAFDQINAQLGGHAAPVRQAYVRAGVTGEDAYRRRLVGDVVFGMPLRWIARHHATVAPTFLYEFAYVTADGRASRKGAEHTSDVVYLFGNMDRSWTPATAEDRRMGDVVHACYVAFIKGRPGCGAGAWPRYAASSDRTLVFGLNGPVAVTGHRRPMFDALEASPLLSVATGRR